MKKLLLVTMTLMHVSICTPLSTVAKQTFIRASILQNRAPARCAHTQTTSRTPTLNEYTNALVNALYDKDIEQAQILLFSGADIHNPFENSTLLHLAVWESRRDFVDLFIKHGANINSQNHPDNQTPLHLAAQKGNHDLVLFLLHQGAQTDLRNLYNRTAAEEALHYGHIGTQHLISEYYLRYDPRDA